MCIRAPRNGEERSSRANLRSATEHRACVRSTLDCVLLSHGENEKEGKTGSHMESRER